MSEGLGTAAALGKMNGGKMKILVHHDVGKRLLEEVEQFCARGLDLECCPARTVSLVPGTCRWMRILHKKGSDVLLARAPGPPV